VDILFALLENPILVSASTSLKANPEKKFSVSEESNPERSKWLYLFQREYATVDPAFVHVRPLYYYFKSTYYVFIRDDAC